MKYYKFKGTDEVLKIEDRLFKFVKINEGNRIEETDETGIPISAVVKIEVKEVKEPKPEESKQTKPEEIADLVAEIKQRVQNSLNELKEEKINAPVKRTQRKPQTKKA
jgi:hypothetical protein